jgi:type II secretory pathway component PulF
MIGKEKNLVIENLTMLLSAGVSITSALETIALETRSGQLKKILAYMENEIKNGSTLWRVVKISKIFNAATISLIKAGEESGRLSENLRIIAEQDEKNRSLASKIKSAMIYPIIVMGLAVVIGTGVAWFILPRLTIIFVQMNIPLPLPTRILVGFGDFLGKYGTVFVPSFLVAMIFTIYFTFFRAKTKYIGQSIIFALPGFKKLILQGELARFGYLFGTLLQAGLPIEEAMNSLVGAADFYRYKNLYAFLKTNIEEGNSFQKSLDLFKGSKWLMPRAIQQMINAGERSGSLSTILLKIGEIYQEKTELTAKNLTVILEPILLVIVWLGVLGIAMAIIMPIYGLVGNLNN